MYTLDRVILRAVLPTKGLPKESFQTIDPTIFLNHFFQSAYLDSSLLFACSSNLL